MHHFYYLGNGFDIFLCFSIQFYISDMTTTCDGMERSFPLDFINNGNRLFYIYMERVYVIIIVCYARNSTIFSSVHTGKATGKSFCRSCKNGKVQLIFCFIIIGYFVHFQHCLI